MGRHVCYGIMGFLRLLHDRFKFTLFDTLLQYGAENDVNYGLSIVINPDLFVLLYTAANSMYLCDNTGFADNFIPFLKNSSLFLFRYFKTLCTRELNKFSVWPALMGRSNSGIPTRLLGHRRRYS